MPGAILTDIEGTTSSIRFVKEVLFPYAAAQLQAFLEQHWQTPAVQEQIAAMADIVGESISSVSRANDVLQQWIREDRKVTPLKALQGMIWQDGYRRGEYRAHIYEDAARALAQWHASDIPLYVYSSGSIKAQQLFFSHSEAGDLTPLFSGYFDTTSGPKQSADSYRSIAANIGLPATDILFLSDVEAELDAAREAGMNTTLLARAQDSDVDPKRYAGPHPLATSFTEIDVTGGARKS